MAISILKQSEKFYANTTFPLWVSISNTDGSPAVGQTPFIFIQRASDGLFFDGTDFVTSVDPIALAMLPVHQDRNPGLYVYMFAGPALVTSPGVTSDEYLVRCSNDSGVPAGQAWSIYKIENPLRNINTYGV